MLLAAYPMAELSRNVHAEHSRRECTADTAPPLPAGKDLHALFLLKLQLLAFTVLPLAMRPPVFPPAALTKSESACMLTGFRLQVRSQSVYRSGAKY
jgi:hypothetical protein